MLKRTKGRLLLTLLVITGFAGTINDNSLTKQERKFAVSQLKDTKADVLKNIKNLSEAQLNFKPSTGQSSMKECFYQLVQAESGYWAILEQSMKKPATPEKRPEAKISDEYLLKVITDGNMGKGDIPGLLHTGKPASKSMGEAITYFKSARAQHLKYVKITTEDLRNHFVPLSFGWVDCYQLILLMSGYSNSQIQQISDIMADPHFPKK
jgi:hypothetical protein